MPFSGQQHQAQFSLNPAQYYIVRSAFSATARWASYIVNHLTQHVDYDIESKITIEIKGLFNNQIILLVQAAYH